jgi:hypothetical protein
MANNRTCFRILTGSQAPAWEPLSRKLLLPGFRRKEEDEFKKCCSALSALILWVQPQIEIGFFEKNPISSTHKNNTDKAAVGIIL